jgi:hypothetical protein
MIVFVFALPLTPKAWRIAVNSIPSARLTAVYFYLQFKLRLIAQLKSVSRNYCWLNEPNVEERCSARYEAKLKNKKLKHGFRPPSFCKYQC